MPASGYCAVAGSAAALLPLRLQHAAVTYAAAYEAIEAGGSAGGGFTERVSGGAIKEGRQFHAVKLSAFLARLNAAVGSGSILLAPRSGQAIANADLWRMATVEGRSMAAILRARGLARDAGRQRALREALISCAERVADAIGATGSPWRE